MNKINILNYFKILILTIVITILLMVLVATIPREYIKNNMVKSTEQLAELGEKSITNLRF